MRQFRKFVFSLIFNLKELILPKSKKLKRRSDLRKRTTEAKSNSRAKMCKYINESLSFSTKPLNNQALFNDRILKIEERSLTQSRWQNYILFASVLVTCFMAILVSKQNDLFDRQNDKFEIQNNLLEAERRSSLVFLMNNIFDEISEEIADDTNKDNTLSNNLIARIASLSNALKPYKYLPSNSNKKNAILTKKPISPERGHLLYTLLNSNLAEETLSKIYELGDFKSSEIHNMNFNYAYLDSLDLSGSDIYDSHFRHAKMNWIKLLNCTISESDFWDAELSGAKLSGRFEELNFGAASLIASTIQDSLFDCFLFGTNLKSSKLWNAVFIRGVMEYNKLDSAFTSHKCQIKTKSKNWLSPQVSCPAIGPNAFRTSHINKDLLFTKFDSVNIARDELFLRSNFVRLLCDTIENSSYIILTTKKSNSKHNLKSQI